MFELDVDPTLVYPPGLALATAACEFSTCLPPLILNQNGRNLVINLFDFTIYVS